MSDHPDIIWVNEYPDGSGVTHPSRAKAEANVIHDGTTAAYQRLPDGVDPEAHEQVNSYIVYTKTGAHHGTYADEEGASGAVTHRSGRYIVETTGWKPKPQPTPWIPSEGDWFEYRYKDWTPEMPWELAHCVAASSSEISGHYATSENSTNVHWRLVDGHGFEFRLADPPKKPPPYIPAPKDIFKVDGVRYQRSCENAAAEWVTCWNMDRAYAKYFATADIESGDVVCVKVEADD